MCVTAGPANIRGTRTYVYAATLDDAPVHVCGYQNEAESLAGGNCMFLNFAGSNLALVRGPELTNGFMHDMTAGLEELVHTRSIRGGLFTLGARSMWVEDYGDYTVILAQEPNDILSALSQVPHHRRPVQDRELEAKIDFYMSRFGQDSFALACFDGAVKPQHPITVSYRPRDPQVLTIPGLDGHDGRLPEVGAPVFRGFRVAFAAQGLTLPHWVHYTQAGISGKRWAPSSVAGFVDNRFDGPNGDYVVPISALYAGLTGRELAAVLQ